MEILTSPFHLPLSKWLKTKKLTLGLQDPVFQTLQTPLEVIWPCSIQDGLADPAATPPAEAAAALRCVS